MVQLWEPVHLTGANTSVVLDIVDGQPSVVYWGPALGNEPIDQVLAALDRPAPEAELDTLAPLGILAEARNGFVRHPGVQGHRADGTGWAPRLTTTDLQVGSAGVTIMVADPVAGLSGHIELRLGSTGVVEVEAALTNTGSGLYQLDGVTISLPLPGQAREAMLFGGRWANEFRPERHRWDSGTLVVDNRRGRTSHDRLPAIFAGSSNFSEELGEVWAGHLGWSGNSHVRIDVSSDGQRMLQAGELLLPGEVKLEPGDTYCTPTLYGATSSSGLNGISASFHAFLRNRPDHPTSTRPVIMNSWEAVYFDHDVERLQALADRAAKVGVERFVLDDGWFLARRNDGAGLGDWTVDPAVWPDGLGPLVDHVKTLGMDFGIWVEPEMVNKDSDLYRAHPDWVLTDPGYEPVLARNQLVLDLSRPEAFAYIRGQLETLLETYDISYLKWDMNRDLAAPSHEGRATVRAQTLALYRLLDEVRAAYPDVEIESCSSGGARADFEILQRTQRIWASDCNDALDRQRIQRGFSYLFPPEVMGAHIAAQRDHTTGRQHRLHFRAATAFFGHMGVEWDLLSASDSELQTLSTAIAAHKQHRHLLHTGTTIRLDYPDPAAMCHGVIAADRSEALVGIVQMGTSDALPISRVRVPGLDSNKRYHVRMVDLGRERLGKAKYQPRWLTDGVLLTGRQLATAGIQPPVLDPQSAIILSVVRETGPGER